MHAAPLLCAGLIGYRAYRLTGPALRLGIYGFGAAAHIIAQVARSQGRNVFAFVTPGDHQALGFARDVGVTWAGFSNQPPPRPLDAAIIFAPVGALVPEALSRVAPGGIVVCAGIHMSDIPSFPYRLLWQERIVRSVASLTRDDAREFMTVAAHVPLETHVRDARSSTPTRRSMTCVVDVCPAPRSWCLRTRQLPTPNLQLPMSPLIHDRGRTDTAFPGLFASVRQSDYPIAR